MANLVPDAPEWAKAFIGAGWHYPLENDAEFECVCLQIVDADTMGLVRTRDGLTFIESLKRSPAHSMTELPMIVDDALVIELGETLSDIYKRDELK
jgi:hypothetical protein